MSHIRFEFVLDTILEVSNLLSSDYEFHFYGDIIDKKYSLNISIIIKIVFIMVVLMVNPL